MLEGEALETSSADTYRNRLEAVRKRAVGAGFAEEDAFPSGPRESTAEAVALGVLRSPAYKNGIKTAIGE